MAKKKISINANPAGTLEVREYFNHLAQTFPQNQSQGKKKERVRPDKKAR